MSESHYWPGPDQPGEYHVERRLGDEKEWEWDGKEWRRGMWMRSTQEMVIWGYLGVRREHAKIDEHAEEVAQLKAEFANAKDDAWDWMLVANERGAEIEKLRAEAERLKSSDLDALVREAIAEFRRDVKQPTKAADWAFRWTSRFIEAVES